MAGEDGEYFSAFGEHMPARSVSPAPFLKTSPELPSRSHGEQETLNVGSNFLITRTNSPSDNLSTILSPRIGSYSSGGGSLYSSDAGHSPCSLESSGYLTPPQFQVDYDKRPYKARRRSSGSLTLISKHSKIPKFSKLPGHDRRKHKCRHRKSHGRPDTYERVLPQLWSDPVPPVVFRRWSSVEIGSHQIHVATTLPPKSVTSVPRYDIVRTIRDRLTFCKMPSIHFQTPTTITLRRATGASMAGMSTVTELLTLASDHDKGGATPRQYPISQEDKKTDTAYLITGKEIDSITELIETNLIRDFRPHNRASTHTRITPPAAEEIQSPTFTLRGMIPNTASPDSLAATEAQADYVSSKNQESLSCLKFASPSKMSSKSLPRICSNKSTHEVIWQPGGSPTSLLSGDEDDHSSITPDISSPQDAPQDTPLPASRPHELQEPLLSNKGDDLVPNSVREPIGEWSWRLPPTEILAINTSGSEPATLTSASKVPPELMPEIPVSSVVSAPEVRKEPQKVKSKISSWPVQALPETKDVFSFPPLLSRKTTSDWYSPLPDIISSLPKTPSPQSLYNEGIDATGAISALPTPTIEKPAFLPFTDSPNSSSLAVEFESGYNLRRKSVIRAHPQSPARTGCPASMGSSIGASSGERRKSSFQPGLQRVRTIDNINKGKRAGTWTRNRPPSICPWPIPPSPEEADSENESSPRTIPGPTLKSEVAERPRSVRDVGAALLKMDRVGIYGKITGTVKSALGLDDCRDGCPQKHQCYDCVKNTRNPSVDWIG